MLQLDAARKAHQRRLFARGEILVVPGEREPVGPGDSDQTHRRLRRARADDLDSNPRHALQRLAPRDERRQHEIAERPVVVQQTPQVLPLHGDVAQRLGRNRGQVHGLTGEQVQLAEEARSAVTDELVAGGVEDRDLPLLDRDERIRLVADPEQHVTDACSPLLPDFRKPRQL